MPEGTVGIGSNFVVVAKIVGQYFQIAAIRVAAKYHPLAVRGTVGIHSIATQIDHRFTVAIHNLFAVVAKVEVQLAIGTLHKGVYGVVGLLATQACKQGIPFVRFIIPVGITQQKHVRAARNDRLIVDGPDAQCGIDIGTLVEYSAFVGFGVAIGVFQNENAVAFLAFGIFGVVGIAVIQGFTNPDSAPLVNMQIGRIDQHGFGGEEAHFAAFGYFHTVHRILTESFGGFF